MRELLLDATGWQSRDDFYDAFFRVVGAPTWHGRNLDALNDSIGTGQINKVEVPYRIVVKNLDSAGAEAKQLVERFAEVVHNLAETGCPVEILVEDLPGSRN